MKTTTRFIVAGIVAAAFALAGIAGPVSAKGTDNVFFGTWLSSSLGDVSAMPEGREGYCMGFSSAEVDLTGFDDDGDGLVDEDPADGLDNDLDGLVDEDVTGFAERARIYVTHGLASTVSDSNHVRVYDIETDLWFDPVPSPASVQRRSEGVGVAHGGLIYCMGGRFAGVLDRLEVYDPTSNGWSNLASMGTARAGLAAAVQGNRIYTFGGRTATGGPCSGGPLDVAEVYDISRDVWSPITPPPRPVTDATAVAKGRFIYLIGGCTASSTANATTFVQIYDTKKDKWSAGAFMSTPRANPAVGVLGNTLYAIAGINLSGNTASVEAYDIDKNAWSIAADKPRPVSEVHAAAHGGRLYVPGSGAFGAAQAVLEVFLRK